MATRQCYHCKQWLEAGEPHDCWTTTEAALTADLDEDLREAWERFREAALELGEQRVYASHHSIMFARHSCYAFVRPKRRVLEVCLFLGREVRGPQVRRVTQASKAKLAHILHVTHRDEVEPPLTEWLREAWELNETLLHKGRGPSGVSVAAAVEGAPAATDAAPEVGAAPTRVARPRAPRPAATRGARASATRRRRMPK